MRFLKVVFALAIKEFEQRRSKLTCRKRREINSRFTKLNIPKCEQFTLLVCPLRFLAISAMRRLGNVQKF